MPPKSDLNSLIDRLETGKLTMLSFLRNVDQIGLKAKPLGRLVALPAGPGAAGGVETDGMRRTGTVVRVRAVGTEGNVIEGQVRPGALALTQVFSSGTWHQSIIRGKAMLTIDNAQKTVRPGETINISSGTAFKFRNPGDEPWHFTATHPTWRPDLFEYQFGNTKVTGNEMWFELKVGPDDSKQRPVYNVRADGNRGTFVVVLVGSRMQTLPASYTDGDNVITVLSGSCSVSVNGVASEIARGASVVVRSGQTFSVSNQKRKSALVEIRPDSPRMWNPHESSYEIAPGDFATGDNVWFEYVLPT
jgi:mannose-6-phosphate isomerase-like protein (cupin superfamily)